MFKSLFKGGLLLAFALAACFTSIGFSTALEEEVQGVAIDKALAPSMSEAESALLVEAGSQQPLLEREADTLRSVAGLSKLPGLLVLCEAVDQGMLDLNADVNVSDRAAAVPGPTAFIESGEKIKVENLMKSAVMILAGDAVLAMGESAFGTESAFAEQITSRLNALGVQCTYTDGVGRDTKLSPRMLAAVGAALMRSKCFQTYSSMTYERFTHDDGRETELASANKMLRSYAGCTGVATGSSAQDGYCGVFAVARGDTELICVVLGAKNSATRFRIASDMLDQCFASVRAQKLAHAGDILAEGIEVKGGKIQHVNLVAKSTTVLLLNKSDPPLTPVKQIPESLKAPLSTQDVVGIVSYQTPEGLVMGKVELVPESTIDESLFRDCIREMILTFLRI